MTEGELLWLSWLRKERVQEGRGSRAGETRCCDNRARNLEAEERECGGNTDALQVEGIVASEDNQAAAKVPLDA